MKQFSIPLLLVVLSACLWGQAGQNTTPTQPPAPSAPMQRSMHHHMMPHPMPGMKAHLDTMRAKIADLKTNLAKVKDPATKQALQADLDLWESMAQHMESMQGMMSSRGMGMGMQQDGDGCPCCAGMMKQGGCGMGCCGGNKCMQDKPGASPATEKPAPPAN